MFCSNCGKKVGDAMLFCPFCGAPIVIPEQDDGAKAMGTTASDGANEPERETVQAVREEAAPRAPRSEAEAELLDWSRERRAQKDEWARQDADDFAPLQLDQGEDEPGDWREEISRKKQSITLEKKPPETRRDEEAPVRLEGAAPKLELEVSGAKPTGDGKGARKRANTLVPPKTMDPEDIFMDSKPSAYDEYDPYDDAGPGEDFHESFVYEDEGESSFFMRHLRGIVGLALFVILILMFVIYAFSKAGQLSLARLNLAWSTEAYSTLGYQNYQDGLYTQAGLYYERALQRDPGNYSYASSAAMAYFEANDTEKSAAMLKKCAEIDPTKLEPYVYLLKLYPDAASRPWDITQLLQQGYRQTGDSRLNVTG